MQLFGISPFDLVLRIGVAMAAGIIVGAERESHGRAAGLRTTILVCVAACIAMIISASLMSQAIADGAPNRPDPARLAAGVLSGMGFLGAGSIIRNGNRVQGVTTAATLWFVTMLGLAFGAGMFVLGGAGMVVALLILFVLPPIERKVRNDWYATLTIHAELDAASDELFRETIESLGGVRVKKVDLNYDLQTRRKTLQCELKFKRDEVIVLSEKIVQELILQDGVLQVSWA